jgi:hypothetical protein
MEKTRLLRLLRALSAAERRELQRFVASPYFNRRPECGRLLQALEPAMRTAAPAPDKESAFRAVFGAGTAFDDHRLRMTISFLYRLTGEFLAVQDFRADPAGQQLRLAGELRRRQLPDHFEQAYTEAGAALHERRLRHAGYHEENYRLLLEKYRFDAERHPTAAHNLQELSDRLDYAFLARKLWQACFMLSHQAFAGAAYDFGLLDAALDSCKSLPGEPAVTVYYYCYRALADPRDVAHFHTFKDLLFRHAEVFPVEELRDLYILAINFCIRQYNAGNLHYLDEQFDFYREGLAKRYFLVDGVLSYYTYLNAVTSALVKREYDWVERFIDEYRDYLREPYREPLYSFNRARLEYLRREPGRALQLLQKAEYKDVLLNLAAKTLQLKIFYELGETDLLESHLQAIKTFIRRKKVMGYHRDLYLNLVHFTRKLLELPVLDKAQREVLRAEIAAAKGVAEKEWLLLQSSD